MGRAASSCLKIMACGGRAPAGEDAVAPPPPPAEAKSPQDKAKWNFLLRSSRNQVSSNSVTVSGPLASVPEKDEDSEASNKDGTSPQPDQAAGGEVRMMKFAEFVPKLSFHLTDPEPFVEDSGSVKDAAAATDSTGSTSHRESKSSVQQLAFKDDDEAEDDSAGTSTGSKAAEAAAGPPPACDAATMETGCSAKESVAVENVATEYCSNPSLHASETSTPTPQSSVHVDRALITESAALKIQTAVRAHLAELQLKKKKNESATKLQAAARTYLVRREAVGTLRCVQAILKMQTLVRARRMHHNTGKLDNKHPLEALVQEAERMDCFAKEGGSASGSNALCLPNEKLLNNGFILQLLESAPRSKRIYISCEPSRSDSAWRWLERWMSVISSDSVLHQEPNLDTTHAASEELLQNGCSTEESSQPCAAIHLPEIPMLCPEPNFSVEENLDCRNVIQCNAAASTPGLTDEASGHPVDNNASDEESEVLETDADQLNLGQEVGTHPFGINIEPAKERRHVEDSCNAGTVSSEKKEPEVKPFSYELTDSNNAEFAAEQFDSKPMNAQVAPSLLISSHLEIPEGKIPIAYSHDEAETVDKEGDPNTHASSEAETVDKEGVDSHDPNTHASSEADSETSLSSSSSSESPESSDSESEQVACEQGDQESGNHDAREVFTDLGKHENGRHYKDNPSETLWNENLEIATENARLSFSTNEFAEAELSARSATLDEQDAHQHLGLSHSADDHVELELAMKPPTLDEQERNGDNQQAYSSSPERYPSHQMVEASSYETPPSQIQINNDNVDACDDNAHQKQCSEPTSKSSLSETKHASDLNPDESVPDSKTAKKRHSIGSNNSLPNYMQATESARAKVNASVSPKGSPDLKDRNRKKRLSPPAGTEKHNSSPRMQRSGSQVHQNPKPNGVHTPLSFSERRWQR